MGNRAVIAFDNMDNKQAVYLQWNGGRDSIRAFLLATRILMPKLGDSEKAISTLKKVIGSFIDFCEGKLDTLDKDNHDHGVFIIDTKTLRIKGRKFKCRSEQAQHNLGEFTVELLG